MSKTAATPEFLALGQPAPLATSVLERVALQSERLGETLRASIRRHLRWSCEVEFGPASSRRVGSLADFAGRRAFWHSAHLVDGADASKWDVLLGVEPTLVHAAIDRSLGGPGETIVPARAPTALELELGREFVRQLHEALVDALAAPPLQFRTSKSHAVLEPLQTYVEDVHEAVLELAIRVDTRAGRHQLRLALRASAITADEPVEAHLDPPRPAAHSALSRGELEVEVELARCRLPLDELRELEAGDVVLFETPAGAPVELRVQDEVKARGRLGVSDGHYAIEIQEVQSDEASGERGDAS